MESKLADMEDINKRGKIHVTSLEEGLESSMAIQLHAHSLAKWFPTLSNLSIDCESVSEKHLWTVTLKSHIVHFLDKWSSCLSPEIKIYQ